MKKGIFISVALATILVLLSSPVMARGGKIRMGNLKIVPSLGLEAIADDNIFLGNGSNTTDELKESDSIAHVKPGLSFDYTMEERGTVSLGYEGDFAYYDKNDRNDWKSHKALFNIDYEAPGGLIAKIDNTYTETQDPYGGYAEYNIGKKTERWSNDLKNELGYKLGSRFKAFLYYNYYTQDYEADADFAQDYYSHEAGTGVEMQVLPKTWGFIRYYYGLQDYDTGGTASGTTTDESNDSDFTWHKIDTGLTWDTGFKFSGELNFGYQAKKYDNDLTADSKKYNDNNTWVAATSIFYDVVTAEDGTMITQLGLTIDRSLNQTSSTSNSYYEDTGAGISFKQKLLTKITLEGSFSYNFHDYFQPDELQNREDDNYEAGLSVDYQARDWLSARAGYTYKEKHSNKNDNNYEDNKFNFKVTAEY